MNLNDINLDNQIECRICFDDKMNDELISPCRCNGTSKYIHRGCLHTWRQYNLGKEGETHCMECREEYILRRKHQYEPNNLFRRGIFPFICFNYLLSILIAIMWSVFTLMSKEPDSLPLIKMLNGGYPEPTIEECQYSYTTHNDTCKPSNTMSQYLELPKNIYSYVMFHSYFLLSTHTTLYTLYYYYTICKKVKRVNLYIYLNKASLIFWNIYCFRFFILYYLASRVFYEPSLFFGIAHINIFLDSGCLVTLIKKHDYIIDKMNYYDNDEEVLNWHMNPALHLEYSELEIPTIENIDTEEEYNDFAPQYSSEEEAS